jgi:hypothetical protein
VASHLEEFIQPSFRPKGACGKEFTTNPKTFISEGRWYILVFMSFNFITNLLSAYKIFRVQMRQYKGLIATNNFSSFVIEKNTVYETHNHLSHCRQ